MADSQDKNIWLNPLGNDGMATGGTGDVLSGLIAGFLAQGMGTDQAARSGVWFHSMAGDLAAETTALLAAIARCRAPVIVVSNEVGWSVVPDNALARRFTDAQGRLNQALAAQATRVIAVIAGLPMALK